MLDRRFPCESFSTPRRVRVLMAGGRSAAAPASARCSRSRRSPRASLQRRCDRRRVDLAPLAAAAADRGLAVAAAGQDRPRRRGLRSTTSTASKRPRATCGALHRHRRRVICYLDVGSWESYRPDAGELPALGDRPSLRRLPRRALARHQPLPPLRHAARSGGSRCARARASTRSSPTTSPVGNRKTRPASRSPAPTSSASTAGSPVRSTRRGMAVALKNDGRQVQQLVDAFDFAIVEQCFQYHECGYYEPFVDARQGGLRGRVRTRTGRVLRRRRSPRLQRDPQVLRPLREALDSVPGSRIGARSPDDHLLLKLSGRC